MSQLKQLVCLLCIVFNRYLCNGLECGPFNNYLTINQGIFEDVCGDISINGFDSSYLDGDTYKIFNNNFLYFDNYVTFDNSNWAILYEGYSTKSSSLSGYNMIMGPGGQSGNCQLRYQNGNGICIYSYYGTGSNSPSLGYNSYSQCISLPDDINVLHTLLLYYDDSISTLYIYQNNKFVTSVQKELHIAFARIGAWYHTYYGEIAVKRIAFSFGHSLNDLLNSIDIILPTYSIFCGGLVGIECPRTYECVPDPTNTGCINECGAADCGGVCAKSRDTKCGGTAGTQCGNQHGHDQVCVDNIFDSCNINCGGADCQGNCYDIMKTVSCGGIAGIQCPVDKYTYICIDDPFDSCDPDCGGTDCPGLCAKLDGNTCGGILGTQCEKKNYECYDVKGDQCSSQCSGVDCGGECAKIIYR